MGCRWFYPPGGTKTLQYNLGKKTDSTESCKLNHGYEPCSIQKMCMSGLGDREITPLMIRFFPRCVYHISSGGVQKKRISQYDPWDVG